MPVDDLFSMSPTGRNWYCRGVDPKAVWTMIVAGGTSVAAAILPSLAADAGGQDVRWFAGDGWFVGCGLGVFVFWAFESVSPRMPRLRPNEPGVSDGAAPRETQPQDAGRPTG